MPDLQTASVFLIVALLGMLGKFLKESKFFPDEMIPNILGVLGGLIGTILFKDPTAIAWNSPIIQTNCRKKRYK